MKPHLGMIVQYRYKPGSRPQAAMVTEVHEPRDGIAWVSLEIFDELRRWVPMVEFKIHCTSVTPPRTLGSLAYEDGDNY